MNNFDKTSLESQNSDPVHINMIGGTMPGLMFYLGYMVTILENEGEINLKSISGTSAGAFIAALVVVGKIDQALDLIMEAFGDDTGKMHLVLSKVPIFWGKGLEKRSGMVGEKTIQQNLYKILFEHVTEDAILNSKIQLKTLHMLREKGLLLKNLGKKASEYPEVRSFLDMCMQQLLSTVPPLKKLGETETINFINSISGKLVNEYNSRSEVRNTVRVGIREAIEKIPGIQVRGEHEIFDSRCSEIVRKYKGKILDIVAGSFSYSPVALFLKYVILDGEFGSWHHNNNSSIEMTGDLGDDEELHVLTRFEKNHKEYQKIKSQLEFRYPDRKVIIIGPEKKLEGGVITVERDDMMKNFQSGVEAAKAQRDLTEVGETHIRV